MAPPAETADQALQGIQFAAISEQRLRYKLANFLFLPEELEDLDQLLKETAAAFAGDVVYLAHLNTYDAFFELITRIKKRCQIKNSAAAFLRLMELARVGLEQILIEETLPETEGSYQEAGHGLG